MCNTGVLDRKVAVIREESLERVTKHKKTFRHVSYIYQAYCLDFVSLSISFESLISFLHLALRQRTIVDITFVHKEALRLCPGFLFLFDLGTWGIHAI